MKYSSGSTLRRTLSSFIFVTFIIASAWGSRFILSEIDQRFAAGKALAVDAVLQETGQTVSWASISPSILRRLTFYGVELTEEGTARSVSIGLNLGAILFGQAKSPVSFVTVDTPRLTIDDETSFARLEQTIRAIAKINTEFANIVIRIRNGKLIIEDGDRRGVLDNVEGDIAVRPGKIVTGKIGTDLVFFDSSIDLSLSTSVTTGIERDPRSGEFAATIDLQRIESNLFNFEDQSFRVTTSERYTEVQRVKSDTPLDLSLLIDSVEESIAFDFQSAGFQPLETVQLRGALSQYNSWLSQPISGTATGEVWFDGTLKSAEVRIRSVVANREVIPSPVPFEIAAEADSAGVTVSNLIAYGSTGYLQLSGYYRWNALGPNGTVTARNFRYSDIPLFDGTATISATSGGIGFSSPRFTFAETDLYDIVGEYTPLASRHGVAASAAFDPEGNATVLAKANIADFTDVTGMARLVRVPLPEIQTMANTFGLRVDLPPETEGIIVSTETHFSVQGPDLAVRVPYFIAEDSLTTDRIATARGEYRNGTIHVDRFYLGFGNLRADATGFVHIGSGGTIDFDTDFRVNGVRYDLRGLATQDGNFLVVGPYNIGLKANTTPRGGIRVNAGAIDVPIPLGNASLSATVDGLFLSDRDWYLTFPDLQLKNVPMPAGGTASATLAVSITPSDVDVAIVAFSDFVGDLSGGFRAEYRLGENPEIRANGSLVSPDGSERYRIAGRVVPDAIALDLRFDAAPLRRIDPTIRSGTLTGAVQIVGTNDAPQGRVYLESDTVRIGGQEARFRLRGYADDRVVRLRDTEIVAAARTIEIDEIRVDRSDGSINGAVVISPPQGGESTALTIRGSTEPIARLQELSWSRIPLTLTVDSQPEGEEVVTNRYSLAKTLGRIDFRRNDDAMSGTILDTGEFSVEVSDPFPARAKATGTIKNGEIALTASGISVDMENAGEFLPIDTIQITGGTVEGSLRVLGPIADPDFFGTLRVRNAALTTEFSPDPVAPFDAAIILEGKEIRIPEFETRIGSATASISGLVLLSRLALSEFQLTLDIPDATPGVHIASGFDPLTFDGFIRGNVVITGMPSEFDVEGDFVVASAEIGVVQSLITSLEPELPDTNVNADITLRTGSGVRFIWPAADFPIIRSSFAVGQEINIVVQNGGEQLALNGEIEIQSGDIFYFDRNFLIREGKVVFQETADEFNPRVSIRAELREVTPDGPVRIYLVADEQRLSDFSPRFESNPPLGGAEVLAILGGNIFQQGNEEFTNLSTALLSTSDIVTQFGVFREFENAIRSRLDLDLFAIRTSVIQNLVLTAITPTDESTEQLAPTLGNYLNNTSIFMGRYIGESVFGQAIVQLRSSDFENPDEDDGIQRLGGVLIDSEISLEWQTPFFMLEWNLAPENPEELFIRDNTFTFSWSFTY